MGFLSKFSNLPTTKSLQLFGLFPDDDIDDDDDDRPFFSLLVKGALVKEAHPMMMIRRRILHQKEFEAQSFLNHKVFYKPVWFNLAAALTMFLCLLPRLGRSF